MLADFSSPYFQAIIEEKCQTDAGTLLGYARNFLQTHVRNQTRPHGRALINVVNIIELTRGRDDLVRIWEQVEVLFEQVMHEP